MGWLSRVGLAIVHPRWALSLAGDRRHAGRSGSDLLIALGLLLLATQLSAFVAAAWLGSVTEWSLGARVLVDTLTRTLTIDLGFLIVGALVLFALSRARDLGRSFDLACVTALPLVFVDIAATTVVRALDISVPVVAMWTLSGIAYAWTGTLVALAVPEARRTGRTPVEPPAEMLPLAKRAGLGVVAVALAGAVVQLVSIAREPDLVRPMTRGMPAPAFSLPVITDAGTLGEKRGLPQGKVVVLDFWATWCSPCLSAMPKLQAFAARHPELEVITVNMDDPAEARRVFTEGHYTLTLLSDDELTHQRYGVTTIPHTVIIDRTGTVKRVVRGGDGPVDLEAEVTPLLR